MKLLREAKGWSQEYVAGKVHVTQPAVSQWESDKTTPSKRVQFELADLYGCTRSWLMCSELVA